MARGLWLVCCAALVAGGVVAAQGAAASRPAHAARHCRRHGRHRCRRKSGVSPKPGRHYGSVPRATAYGEEYADFLTSEPPVKVGLGRTGLLFTCQPGGRQAFIDGAWPVAKVRRTGTFRGTANVVQAAPLDPLFENATSGTETWSGRFTSSTAGTLTLKVTGMGVSGYNPADGSDFVGTPSTCDAGPKTFRFKIFR